MILDLVKNADDARLAMKISSEMVNLQGRLIDVEQQALALQNENQELRDQIRTLKDTSEESKVIRAQLVHEDNAYFRAVDGQKSGPFCTACWDDARKLTRLTSQGFAQIVGDWSVLHICALHPKHQVPMSEDYGSGKEQL